MSLMCIKLNELMERSGVTREQLIQEGIQPDELDAYMSNGSDGIFFLEAGQIIDAIWRATGLLYTLNDLFYFDYFLPIYGRGDRDIFIQPDGSWDSVDPGKPWGIIREDYPETE